jgi:26S proteasome regulatory subunit N2
MSNDDITLIERLYEDDSFPLREMAAAVASKFYFHLEQFEDAVEFALFSGEYFSTDSKSEYVDTIVSKCIDAYIEKQQKEYAISFSSKEDQKDGNEEDDEEDPEISEKMTSVVERMFERCYSDGQHMQALGIALESRRLDHIERSILESNDVSKHLDFCFNFCRLHVSHRGFRQVVLKILAKLYRTHCETPDYINVCQCLQFLGDAEGVASVLLSLLKRSDEDALVSYQVGFRIYENENQQFMRDIIRALPETKKTLKKKETSAAVVEGGEIGEAVAEEEENKDEEEEETEQLPKEIQERLERLVKILDGRTTMELHLAFLCANNKTDLLILKKMKDSFQRNTVLHNAVVVAHAYMNSGTTQHTFLRNNEQWLTKATNWARFSAIGGIGVVCVKLSSLLSTTLQPLFFFLFFSLFLSPLLQHNNNNTGT